MSAFGRLDDTNNGPANRARPANKKQSANKETLMGLTINPPSQQRNPPSTTLVYRTLGQGMPATTSTTQPRSFGNSLGFHGGKRKTRKYKKSRKHKKASRKH